MREANGRRLIVALALTGAIFSTTIQAQTPGASLMPADKGASAAKHFDPLGKPASKFTLELRNGQPGGVPPRSTGPDVVRAMSTEQWLDFIAISMDPKKADGMNFTINLVTPDNREQYVVEMSNATLTTIKGFRAAKPDLTVTVNRSDLNQVMMGATSFDDLIKAGKAKFDGSRAGFDKLRSILVMFTPDFEILPGTAPKQPSTAPKPFEVHNLFDHD